MTSLALRLVVLCCVWSFIVFPAEAAPGDASASNSTAAATPQSATVPFIVLDKSRDWALADRNYGLTARELSRQAFWIAARERLGIPTADVALSESAPVDARVLRFSIAATSGDHSLIEVLKGPHPTEASVFRLSLPAPKRPADSTFDFAAFTDTCEKLSRTEFLAVLEREIGGRARPPVLDESRPPLSPDLERELDEIDVVAQFLLLRRLHGLTPTQLAPKAKWGAVARAYATLGLLTECYWSPMENVFKARALLYAQGLVAAAPRDPTALWHRAYVFALAGMHVPALADFREAAKLAEGSSTPVPAWAAAAEALCRYDTRALHAVAKDAPSSQLAALLRAVAFELSAMPKRKGEMYSAVITTTAATAILEADARLPNCSRILQGIQLRLANEMEFPLDAPPVGPLRSKIYQRLSASDDLPKSASEIIAGIGASPPKAGTAEELVIRAKLIAALTKSNPAEDIEGVGLAWTVLGRLLEEESFLELIPIESAPAGNWSGANPEKKDSPERRASIAQVLAGHPYRAYVPGGTGDATLDRKISAELAENFDADAVVGREWRLPYVMREHDPTILQRYHDSSLSAKDDTVGTNARERSLKGIAAGDVAPLLAISPYSPTARAMALIEYSERFADRLAEWERDAVEQPGVLLQLGAAHARRNRLADAERCLTAAAKLEPDYLMRSTLAEVYLLQDRTDQWLQELEALATEYPDNAGSLWAAIAKQFLNRRDLPRAREFAERALESKSLAGMLTAACVYEVMQDWRNSEFWIEELAKADPVASFEWLLWCKRTGQGNLKEASKQAREFLDARRRAESDHPMYRRGDITAVVYLLLGEEANARRIFEDAFQQRYEAWWGLNAALLADARDETERRDTLLKEILTPPRRVRGASPVPSLIAVTNWIVEDLKAGGDGKLDREVVERAIETSRGLDAVNCCYFLAAYLDHHGQPELAIRYWKRCMLSSELNGLMRSLAGAALTKRGVLPESYKEALQRPLVRRAVPK